MKMVEILLIEDNPADVELTRESLRESRVINNLHAVDTGEAALRFLRNGPGFGDKPRPDLIFLDLNLPGMDGKEVLKRIKEDPGTRDIPVVVLTSSTGEEDVLRTYQLHANCFVSKPLDLQRFTEVVRKIEDFWFGIVRLPPRSG